MLLPAEIGPGGVLRFTVTLVNAGRTEIALDPCPGYTEGFYDGDVMVRRSFRLNCDARDVIPAHGQVRYAMELRHLRRFRTGFGKLGWSLDTPYGPSAGGVVRVTG
jgi:hypothetical protein